MWRTGSIFIFLLGWTHIIVALYVSVLLPSFYRASDLAFVVTLISGNLFLGAGLVVVIVHDCLLVVQAFCFGLKMSCPLIMTLMIYNLFMSLFPSSFLSVPFLGVVARQKMTSDPDLRHAFVSNCKQAAVFCLCFLFYYTFLYCLLRKTQKEIGKAIEANKEETIKDAV